MATHSCILVWEIPWTAEPGGLQSTGSQESDMTEWLTHTHPFKDTHTVHPSILCVSLNEWLSHSLTFAGREWLSLRTCLVFVYWTARSQSPTWDPHCFAHGLLATACGINARAQDRTRPRCTGSLEPATGPPGMSLYIRH